MNVFCFVVGVAVIVAALFGELVIDLDDWTQGYLLGVGVACAGFAFYLR